MPALRGLLLGVALCLATASARADDTNTCIASHVEGQRLKNAGKLREAKEAFAQCVKPECPALLVEDCSGLLRTVEGSLPTVVFEASDAKGLDVADARVMSSGAVLVERLDGKAIELDPGEYTFRFERRGSTPVVRAVVVREGDKARRVVVRFSELAPPPPSKRAVSPAFWAVGAVGLAGLALFAGLGGAGLAKRNDLDDAACKPDCAPADVDAIRGLFVGADISLGLGLAALAVAPIVYFTSPMQPSKGAGLGLGVVF